MLEGRGEARREGVVSAKKCCPRRTTFLNLHLRGGQEEALVNVTDSNSNFLAGAVLVSDGVPLVES